MIIGHNYSDTTIWLTVSVSDCNIYIFRCIGNINFHELHKLILKKSKKIDFDHFRSRIFSNISEQCNIVFQEV